MAGMHVEFVCWGNICRSPMGERVARRMAADRGLDATFTSSGISTEERGNPMDRRARALLTERGYDADGHTAQQVKISDDVDLYLAAEQLHADRLIQQGADPDKVKLITDYDPEAEPGQPLDDPWYGGPEEFETTLEVLERAIPQLLDTEF